jgi:Ni/Co efflux regulator RcnB
MKTSSSTIARLSALALLALLTSTAALADRDDNPGQGNKHGNKHGQGNKQDYYEADRYQDRNNYRNDRHAPDNRVVIDIRLGDNDRRIINDYYGNQFRSGHCPPGLAKKHNGCMPPGQAKKWRQGYPLPRDLAYYPLPADLLYRLPPPPPRHQYVRVAADILLIAVGTSMVVDAIQDIGRY